MQFLYAETIVLDNYGSESDIFHVINDWWLEITSPPHPGYVCYTQQIIPTSQA